MPIELADYADPVRATQWFDVDPRSVDSSWTNWASMRVYAYVPGLMAMIDDLVPVDFSHLASVANVGMADFKARSIIKHERLTAEQIRFVTGSKRPRNDSADVRAVRVDKALLALFAINHELADRSTRSSGRRSFSALSTLKVRVRSSTG